jgi:hypothetical protein
MNCRTSQGHWAISAGPSKVLLSDKIFLSQKERQSTQENHQKNRRAITGRCMMAIVSDRLFSSDVQAEGGQYLAGALSLISGGFRGRPVACQELSDPEFEGAMVDIGLPVFVEGLIACQIKGVATVVCSTTSSHWTNWLAARPKPWVRSSATACKSKTKLY